MYARSPLLDASSLLNLESFQVSFYILNDVSIHPIRVTSFDLPRFIRFQETDAFFGGGEEEGNAAVPLPCLVNFGHAVAAYPSINHPFH